MNKSYCEFWFEQIKASQAGFKNQTRFFLELEQSAFT